MCCQFNRNFHCLKRTSFMKVRSNPSVNAYSQTCQLDEWKQIEKNATSFRRTPSQARLLYFYRKSSQRLSDCEKNPSSHSTRLTCLVLNLHPLWQNAYRRQKNCNMISLQENVYSALNRLNRARGVDGNRVLLDCVLFFFPFLVVMTMTHRVSATTSNPISNNIDSIAAIQSSKPSNVVTVTLSWHPSKGAVGGFSHINKKKIPTPLCFG